MVMVTKAGPAVDHECWDITDDPMSDQSEPPISLSSLLMLVNMPWWACTGGANMCIYHSQQSIMTPLTLSVHPRHSSFFLSFWESLTFKRRITSIKSWARQAGIGDNGRKINKLTVVFATLWAGSATLNSGPTFLFCFADTKSEASYLGKLIATGSSSSFLGEILLLTGRFPSTLLFTLPTLPLLLLSTAGKLNFLPSPDTLLVFSVSAFFSKMGGEFNFLTGRLTMGTMSGILGDWRWTESVSALRCLMRCWEGGWGDGEMPG